MELSNALHKLFLLFSHVVMSCRRSLRPPGATEPRLSVHLQPGSSLLYFFDLDTVILILDVLYCDRNYARFFVLETIARVSYFAYRSSRIFLRTLGGVKYFGELERHYFWGNEVNLYEHHVDKFFTCFATRRQRSSNKASACARKGAASASPFIVLTQRRQQHLPPIYMNHLS